MPSPGPVHLSLDCIDEDAAPLSACSPGTWGCFFGGPAEEWSRCTACSRPAHAADEDLAPSARTGSQTSEVLEPGPHQVGEAWWLPREGARPDGDPTAGLRARLAALGEAQGHAGPPSKKAAELPAGTPQPRWPPPPGGLAAAAHWTHAATPLAPCSPWRRGALRLQRLVNLWPTQLCFAAVLVLNRLSYPIPAGDRVDQTPHGDEMPSDDVYSLATTLALLFVITVCELLVRVAAQGGPLYRKSSWSRFFSLFFHKFEVPLLCIFVYWLWVCALRPLQLLSQGEPLTKGYFLEALFSVYVVAMIRVHRFWGIWFNINVQDEEKRRRLWRSKDRFLWMKEHQEKLQLRNKELLTRVGAILDNVVVQFLIAACVLGQVCLFTLSRAVEALQAFYWATKATGYGIMVVYALEFGVRCAVQGGFEQFLGPTAHKIEIGIVMLGLYFQGKTVWFHESFAQFGGTFYFYAISAGVLLLIHRGIRAFEIRQEVSAAEHTSDSFMDAFAKKKFIALTGLLLRVAPENVSVRFQMPSELKLHLHKAELNWEALQGLHLPIAVRGGLVEELHLSVKGRGWKGDAEVHVKVENPLLLLAPGDGLAEAGGLEPASSYWNPDTVREAKSKLVEIICQHLTPQKEAKEASAEGEEAFDETQTHRTRRWRKAADNIANFVRRVVGIVLDSMLKNMTVDVTNVRVQLDDSDGSLGLDHVTIGAKVGSIKLNRRKGKGSIHRLGVFVQTAWKARATRRRVTGSTTSSDFSDGDAPEASPIRSPMSSGVRHLSSSGSGPTRLVRRLYSSASTSSLGGPGLRQMRRLRSSGSNVSGRARILRQRSGEMAKVRSLSSSASQVTSRLARPRIIRSPFSSSSLASSMVNGQRTQRLSGSEAKLHNLIHDPKLALKEAVRQNHLERWRLWALEGLRQAEHGLLPASLGGPRGATRASDRERHARVQRSPEGHLVFSLLRLEGEVTRVRDEEAKESDSPGRWLAVSRMGSLRSRASSGQVLTPDTPKGDGSDGAGAAAPSSHARGNRRMLAADLAEAGDDSPGGASPARVPREYRRLRAPAADREPEKLKWVVDVREPVSFVVSEEQALAVRTVAACVRSWLIHDSAMKWWPGLRLRDLQDHAERGAVRHTVARMWWIYAVHRVLAQRHKRATSMLMDAIWQGMNLSYYRELLRDMAHCRRPHGGNLPNASLHALQPYKAEAKQVKDLQLLLSLEDIIAQRRRAISALPAGAAGAPASPTPPPQGQGGSRGAQGQLQRLRETSMDQLRRLKSSAAVPTGALDLDPEAAAAGGFSEAAAAAGEESSPTLAMRRSGTALTAASSPAEGSAFWLGLFAGDWEVSVSAVELLVLAGAGEKARARLLHGKLESLFADVQVEAQAQAPAADAEASRSCLFALSVGGFVLTSPDKLDAGGHLLYGAPPEVVRVTRPLRLGVPSSDDIQAAQDLVVPGRARGLDGSLRNGEGFALAAFAALDCAGGGVCEVHLADLSVVVSDLLLDRLRALAGLARPGGSPEGAGGEGGEAGTVGAVGTRAARSEDRAARRSLAAGHKVFQRLSREARAAKLAASYSTVPSSHSRSDGDTAEAGTAPARSGSGALRKMSLSPPVSARSPGGADYPLLPQRSSSGLCLGSADYALNPLTPSGGLSLVPERSSSGLVTSASFASDEPQTTPRGPPQDRGGVGEVKRIYPGNGVNDQKRFNHWLYHSVERLVGLHRDVVMCYHVGAVHVISVSEYSESSLCAQQARIRPFTLRERGEGHGDVLCGFDPRRFSWEFNGFAEGCGAGLADEDGARSSTSSAGRHSSASGTHQQGLMHAVSAVSLRLLPATAAASAWARPASPVGRRCDAGFYSHLRLGCARSDALTVDVTILPRSALPKRQDGTVAAPFSWVHAEAAQCRAELDELENVPIELEAPATHAASPDPSQQASAGTGSRRRSGRSPGCSLSL